MKKQPCETEEQEQKALARYLDMRGLVWFHVPNGGNRSAITGANLKSQGVKPGVPDVFIFGDVCRDGFPGIAIELKRKFGGILSKEQRLWLSILMEKGWHCAACRGADEAILFIEQRYPPQRIL